MKFPPQDLPSLQALRCFESAARAESFAMAAEELCLTTSAISHQIRSLEKIVGKPLFYREGNKVVLTAPGKLLAVECTRALDYFAHAFSVLGSATSSPKALTFASQNAIIQSWLVPRISQVNACLNSVKLYVISFADLQEHVPEKADVALLYGTGNVSGMVVEQVAQEKVFPVCSPDFLQQHPNLCMENLIEMPLLLHSQATWNLWLERAGLAIEYPVDSIFLDDAAHTMYGAIKGQGVAMVRAHLVRDFLEAGLLVKLFDLEVPGIFNYYLAWKNEDVKLANAPLRDWVLRNFPCNA